jgi:amphiphysin
MLATQFIDPLFNSFFYMQYVKLVYHSSFNDLSNVHRLNIYYLILEKMNSFADAAKYDITNVPGSQIAQDYEEKRTDAWQHIENLNIVKRIISVCMYSKPKPGRNNY